MSSPALLEPFTGLRLLHRANSDFFILGATGNVYTITLSATPSCTCSDDPNGAPCKHIIFLYIHVLSVPINDPCLRRSTLRPCQLTRLLSTPVSCKTLASAPIRKRFLELYRLRNNRNEKGIKVSVNVEDGSMCPVCLDELGVDGGRRLVACATCKNPIHEECLMAWKKKRSRTTCVICRARWKEIGEQGKYINLSTYVSQEENCGVQ
uniref:mitogen-activated protein kinase kinase kinase 1 n=1 Tax=Erigeron canadensis TaxID=72917 RepID=UPI001CB9383F|nr:mitogen-activated protein kinase kinase kinase 1 [Erigeron canadensis]